MCREGGCGSCMINAEIFDLESQQPKYISINTVNINKNKIQSLKLIVP